MNTRSPPDERWRSAEAERESAAPSRFSAKMQCTAPCSQGVAQRKWFLSGNAMYRTLLEGVRYIAFSMRNYRLRILLGVPRK